MQKLTPYEQAAAKLTSRRNWHRELDQHFGRVFDGLLGTIATGSKASDVAARLLFVAKHIERIGDYVKDICELNVYLSEAVFIKHSPAYLTQLDMRSTFRFRFKI